jgi:hypothetical protein
MTLWPRIVDFARKIPDWAIFLALGILAGKWYVEREKTRVRNEEKAKAEVREAQATTRTYAVLKEVDRKAHDDADKAIVARDAAPRVSDASGVPDAVAARIFHD